MKRRNPTPGDQAANNEQQREQVQRAQAALSVRGRDIGPVPPIVNVRRRNGGGLVEGNGRNASAPG